MTLRIYSYIQYHIVTLSQRYVYLSEKTLIMYMKSITDTIKDMTTVRLSAGIKSKLVKIGARLSLKDGKARSMEDIIEILIKEYEKEHKE